ncbi:DUF3618 domain-containing protein [Nocardioides sp. GY 10127]|uniref:DUF3618 domain-containing protein n=1 Tax=Nocardioides sp. GY 10127 TaxID=2569762 RepID=UPI0010A7FE03|nr:DUF3618 domain-containing protein [Nocardioides sp. GY 10127]TIC81570.1 DUF3618 domain-containing protein [Nocardioides sp. GY 10127]
MSTDPSALEREMEETRQRLAATIDELLHRASPKTVVSRKAWSVKAHYVDPATGAPRTENILKTAGAVVGVAAAILVVRRLTA